MLNIDMSKKYLMQCKLISSIISFILISYALLIVANNPTTGYESSIYSSTPTIFWIAIIFGLLNGLFLIASDLYGKTGKMWMLGLFQIIFCNFSVISLHAFRGYVSTERWDALSYIGLAKDISDIGYFGRNLYPITSILISQLNQLTNLSILVISKYISSLFFIFYVLSVYCWSKSLIADRKFVLSSLIASTPIFFAWFSVSIHHEVLSVFMLPFFFYLLQRNLDYRFRFFCIIFLIIYPFSHPITAIVVLLYLTIFFISEKFNIVEKSKNVSTYLLLLSFVALVAWFIQQYSLLRSLKSILFQLIGLLKTPTSSDYAMYYLNRLGITAAIRTVGLMITDEIIFCFISLIVISQILLKMELSIVKKLYKISICFIVGNLFLLILFFSTRTHVPYRLINLNFNIMLTPPLVGYLLYKFIKNNKKAKSGLILGLILFSAFIAILSLYPSPITMRPNGQVTISDVKGMNWLITHKNPEIKTADIWSPIFRFADLIYGCKFGIERRDLVNYLNFPDHFGFTEDDLFPIDEDRYLVVTEFSIQGFTEVWKDIGRFDKEDFIKINFCTNVDKIYENGEFRSRLIYENN